MTIDFTCQKCEGTFELDAGSMIEGTEKLVCPHCDAKAPSTMVDDFTAALAELRTQVALLSKKFAVSLAVETADVADELEEVEDSDEEDDDELDLDEDEEDDVDEDEYEDEDVEDR